MAVKSGQDYNNIRLLMDLLTLWSTFYDPGRTAVARGVNVHYTVKNGRDFNGKKL